MDKNTAGAQSLPPYFKPCKLCGEVKPLTDFHCLSKAPDGRQPVCKPCACARTRQWGFENRDHAIATHREYYQKNKTVLDPKKHQWAQENKNKMLQYSRDCWAKHRESRNETKRKYRENNKEKLREYRRKYSVENKDLRNAQDAERRALEKMAMPKWADRVAIKAFYRAAKQRSDETGIKHHVDHIIPITHALVCGLHVPANLQLLTGTENLRKSNTFTPS